MAGYYKHFLKDLSVNAARLYKLKTETISDMLDWALEDFERIKKDLINSEALASPNFRELAKYPFIVGLDFSALAIGVTLNQVQRCLDGEMRRRLIYCFSRKNSAAGVNYSSHHGKTRAFVWALKSLDGLLKLSPFVVETDSM